MKNPFRIFSRPIKAIARFIQNMPHPTMYSVLRLVGTKHDYEAVVGDGQGSSVVMAPLMWLARNSVQANIELCKAEDSELVPHPMVNLLRRPNEHYNGKHLQMALLLSLCSSGNAYVVKVRASENSVPAELWYAPHHLIEPIADYGSTNFIDYYKYHVEGVSELDPRDVIHIRFGVNPRNTRCGLSPLYPVLREAWGDIESANYTAAILKNMGMPGVIISPDNNEAVITGDEAKEVAEAFKAKFGGDRRGEAMVMKGKTKIEQFGFDPSKMEIKGVRNVAEERVCACLGVPAAVVGFGTGMEQTAVGATMKELRQEGWEGGLIPYLDMIADALETSLLPEFERRPENYTVKYNYSQVRALSESEDSKHRRAVANVNAGIWTVARAQRYLGDEPDESQHVYLRRTTVMEIPAQVKQLGLPGSVPLLKAVKRKPPKGSAKLMAAFAQDLASLEPEFETGVLKVLDSLATVLVQSAENLLGGKALKQAIVDDVLKPIDLQEYEAELSGFYGEMYLKTAKRTANSISVALGTQVRITDPMAEQIVATGGKRVGLVDLSATTRARLFSELAEGQRLGEGVPQLIRRIRDVPAGPWKTSAVRARVIARTETLHAQRTSALHSYREMNPTAQVMVFDGRLPTSCEICIDLDGTVMSQDEAWELSGGQHPNCTRSFVIYYE